MDEQTIRQRISTQRDCFATGATLPLSFRLKQLEQLKLALKRHEQDLYTALKADLGKSRMESYMCEIGLTLSELTWMQKHLPKLMRCKTVPTPLAHFAAKSFQSPSPYGTVLIMSPWNYPVLLTLEPLIDALAAGNTVILKPSAYAPHTSQILSQILKERDPPEYVTMITGGREKNQALLNQRFDKIFFTGGKTVGKEVSSSCCRIPDSRHSGAWWGKARASWIPRRKFLSPQGGSYRQNTSTADRPALPRIIFSAMLLFVTGCFRHWKKKSTGSLANSLFKIRITGKSSTKNIFTGCRT